MIGGRTDPQFGPLVVAGLGGVLIELMTDAALAPAPVSVADARRMLLGLKRAALFSGFRSSPAVDLDRLAAIVARASELNEDANGAVAEMDINPLICAGDKIIVVDGLVAKRVDP